MKRSTRALCTALALTFALGSLTPLGEALAMTGDPAMGSGQRVQAGGQTEPKKKDVKQKKKKDKKKDAEKEEETEKLPPAPVTFEGDDISFDSNTGEVYARGNVVITQVPAQVTADEIQGNTKQTEVWINEQAHVVQPDMDLNGYDTFYNYQERTGKMGEMKGTVDQKFVRGESVEFYPDQVIVYNGTVTKCPAQKPDYHISAKKIEIWPNDKMVAYDAKFWVKDVVVYSTPRYETEIGDNKGDSQFPQVGYTSKDGFYIKQDFEAPITDTIYGFFDFGYFTKHDLRNSYGIVKKDPNYTMRLQQGHFRDDDDNWVKKEPEWAFDYAPKRIAGGAWQYKFDAVYGKWTDAYKTSWHQNYKLYFSRDAIALSDTLNLYLGAGYEITRESFDDSQVNSLKYDITLVNQFSDRLSGWTGYHYTENNAALFNYDSTDVAKELASGLSYRFDDKTSVSVAQSYDLENNRVADMDYTIYRDLHCWNMSLQYREKRQEWNWMLKTKHWW